MLPGMGGGGDMDPRKLQQMMQKLGIDIEEIDDVEEVVIRTASEDLVFDDAEVTVMEAQGSRTYQVTGTPQSREREGGSEPEAPFTEEDVEVVVDRAGVSEEEAREALEAADGQPAEAIVELTEG